MPRLLATVESARCLLVFWLGERVPGKDLLFQVSGLTLTQLQYWGKQRGIYSNVMGFLGGVNFAILVARICLHYPRASGSTIVRSFFKMFASWTWADMCPVMICGTDKGGPVASLVWDPITSRMMGKPEIFPIITPCYPASNSTFNVSVRHVSFSFVLCSPPQAATLWSCLRLPLLCSFTWHGFTIRSTSFLFVGSHPKQTV
jgi:hypothetical protein